MQTPYMAILQLAEELETDTPEKERFKKFILSLSDTIWDIYWKDDYSTIDKILDLEKVRENNVNS